MGSRIVWLIVSSLICYQYASAATFYEIDTTHPFKCIFSLKHHNRIMIDKGRIKKIIYPEEKVAIRLEEHSGQAFVYATCEWIKPLTLAVVTESGLVQDIEVEFVDKPSEVLILKEPEDLEQIQVSIQEPQQSEALSLHDKINDILCGRIPLGYASCSIERKKRQVKKGIQIESLVKLNGSNDDLYIYEISNLSKRKQTILENELQCPGSLWIFLEDQVINPKGKILGIISIGKP